MKKCILSLIMAALACTLWAQSPAAFNYQAIFRNSDGTLMQNVNIDIKIELISMTSNQVVYTEIHACKTSNTGLVNLEIGRGETSNSIEDISWGTDNYSIQVSYDGQGTGNFIVLGNSQLLSVPYALYAANSSKQRVSIEGNIIKLTDGGQVILPADQVNDADADATNELQSLTKNGDLLNLSNSNGEAVDLSGYKDNTDAQTLAVADGKLKISGGNEINLSELATGTETDQQTISLTNQVLSISNGNSVDLSVFMDNSDDQKLTLSNDTLYLTNGDKVYLGAYKDNSDQQTLNLSGATLEISNGNSVDLSTIDTKLSETEVDAMVANNGYLTEEADASITNEIQDLELTGNTLKITNNANATEINLAPFTGNDTDDQSISLSGTTLSIEGGNSIDLSVLQDGTTDADADPANEIQQLSLSGNVISLTDGGTVTLPTGFSGDYNDLSNKPSLANVATSGAYTDLTSKPDFTGWDTNAANDFSGNYNDLNNKPVLAGDVTGATGLTSVEKIRGMNISANTPGNGQILKWNATTLTWEPADDQLGAAGSTDGVVSSIGVTGTTTKTITLNRTNGLGILTASFTDNVNDADADATNEIQDLSLSGNTLTLSGDATTVNLALYLDNTDAQTLSLSSKNLTISGGNTIDLSDIDTKLNETEVDAMIANNGYLTSFTEVDGSTTNEIQTLSFDGENIILSKSGGSVTLPDANATNEIQSLGLSENILSLSGDANTVNLAPYLDNTDNQTLYFSGTTLEINRGNNVDLSSLRLNETDVDAMVSDNGYLTSEVDASTSNELQTISISGSSVTLSNSGGTITLPDGSSTNEIQDLSLTGNTLSLTGDATTVSLSTYLDNTDAQQLSISGNNLTISGGNTIALPGVTDTDDQSLSLTGTILTIDGGNSVNLSSIDTKLSEAQVDSYVANNGYITSEVDGSTTNEIQDLSLTANTLSLSGDATTVSLAPYLDNTDAQSLSLSGSTLTISGGNSIDISSIDTKLTEAQVDSYVSNNGYISSEVDGSVTNEIQTLSLSGSSLTISGTGGNTVSLSSLASPFTTTSNVTTNANGDYTLDNFVFGSPTYNYNSNNTHGSRMMFHKSKSAFRAGYCTNTNWNDGFCGYYSFAGGGFTKASGDFSTAFGQTSTASGGYSLALGDHGTASGTCSVAGGYYSTASGLCSVALGNSADATQTGAVAFGDNTNATGLYSFAIGDRSTASGTNSVAMGMLSAASGESSFAMGNNTSASGICSASFGYGAQATGNYSAAFGYYAYNWGTNSFAFGANSNVETSVTYSTAIGRYARAYYNGQLVACDGGSSSSVWGGGDNSFYAKFRGGYYFYTNAGATAGVYLSAGATSWSVASDSTKKENFKAVNGEDFLNKISQFKLTSWNYKGQDAKLYRHYGPMAQDFYNAFGNDGIGTVGCDTMIATADFQGINFIAIQALEKRTAELKQTQEELAKQVEKINEMQALINEQKNQLDELKSMKTELLEIKSLLGMEVSVKQKR